MKSNSVLTIPSLVAAAAALATLSLTIAPALFFSVATCSLILGVFATDYRSPRVYGSAAIAAVKKRERMPLAA